jgi:hypothetical protein
MISKSMEVDGSGADSAMVFHDPTEVPVAILNNALTKIGKQHLIPKSSVMASALKDAFTSFIDRAQIKERGRPIKPFPLSAGVTGFDFRQINPGNEDIDPVFVASVLLDVSGHVRIPKHNSTILPILDTKKAAIEAAIQKVFEARCGVYPATFVSTALQNLVRGLGGILVKKTGGMFFVPAKGVEVYEQLGKELEGSALELTTIRFPLVPTESSYSCVLKSVKNIARDRLLAVEKSIHELGSSKKMRSNGKESRLKECQEVLDLLKDYEEILGVEFTESKELVAKVEQAVHAHAALEWCS